MDRSSLIMLTENHSELFTKKIYLPNEADSVKLGSYLAQGNFVG